MTAGTTVDLDVLIFGGGAAGLWLLDALHRRSYRVALLELRALGAGQTIASQGILHGGLKYALGGVRSASSDAVRAMPELWKACLAGSGQPDLREVRVLSPRCYLWRSESISSRLGLLGARLGLRTHVERVAPDERPAVLGACPGGVYCVQEPVIELATLLHTLASRHTPRILHLVDPCNVAFAASAGTVTEVHLQHPAGGATLLLRPTTVILTAGEGNEALRRAVGLSADAMQRRPLHMVMARGPLPELFGHCVDRGRTRVTITSARDAAGRTVWHVGGEVAEQGVKMDEKDLMVHARRELMSVMPGVDLSHTEWATYRINRAEGRSPDQRRPEGPMVRREGSVVTAWPTKLVLVPELTRMVLDLLPPFRKGGGLELAADWPRPAIAQPPWEAVREWHA